MDEIKLEIHEIFSNIKPADAYAIILIGENNSLLPVIVGQPEMRAISGILNNIPSPRPLTNELFAAFINKMNVRVLKVLIYKAVKGIFYSYIYFARNDGGEFYLDARTSDAIALALNFNAPIYTTSKVMDENKMKQNNSVFVLGLEERSVETLKKKLEEAIESENFEEASDLRDEIKNLEKKGKL